MVSNRIVLYCMVWYGMEWYIVWDGIVDRLITTWNRMVRLIGEPDFRRSPLSKPPHHRPPAFCWHSSDERNPNQNQNPNQNRIAPPFLSEKKRSFSSLQDFIFMNIYVDRYETILDVPLHSTIISWLKHGLGIDAACYSTILSYHMIP